MTAEIQMTRLEAEQLLLSLAREEAKRLELATKMYDNNRAIAPADVRRAAKQREELLKAIEVMQNAKPD